ncbi:MAG TPA: nucleotidyltransferase family protein [Chroococcales cyanobacterium]|jgi:hypothetical protein
MTREEILFLLSSHMGHLRSMGVSSIALFGSVARNEAGPDSDVDILIEFEADAEVGAFEFLDVKEYLEGVLGQEVDLVMPDALRPRLRRMVMEDAIRVA